MSQPTADKTFWDKTKGTARKIQYKGTISLRQRSILGVKERLGVGVYIAFEENDNAFARELFQKAQAKIALLENDIINCELKITEKCDPKYVPKFVPSTAPRRTHRTDRKKPLAGSANSSANTGEGETKQQSQSFRGASTTENKSPSFSFNQPRESNSCNSGGSGGSRESSSNQSSDRGSYSNNSASPATKSSAVPFSKSPGSSPPSSPPNIQSGSVSQRVALAQSNSSNTSPLSQSISPSQKLPVHNKSNAPVSSSFSSPSSANNSFSSKPVAVSSSSAAPSNNNASKASWGQAESNSRSPSPSPSRGGASWGAADSTAKNPPSASRTQSPSPRAQSPSPRQSGGTGGGGAVSGVNALLLWTQQSTEGYNGVSITNFTTSWKSGMCFAALLHAHEPGLLDLNKLNPDKHTPTCQAAFDAAEKAGVAILVDAEDMEIGDKKCTIVQLQMYHKALAHGPPSHAGRDAWNRKFH